MNASFIRLVTDLEQLSVPRGSIQTLLLCTVSRALCDTWDAIAWMQETLQPHLKTIVPDLVINGGAGKGDRDVSRLACASGFFCIEHRTNGWCYAPNLDGSYRQLNRWWGPKGSVHPLERNRFMVTQCAQARDAGWNVHILGLIAPWSRTHGTEHTLAQAMHAGFSPIKAISPREYAPAVPGHPSYSTISAGTSNSLARASRDDLISASGLAPITVDRALAGRPLHRVTWQRLRQAAVVLSQLSLPNLDPVP